MAVSTFRFITAVYKDPSAAHEKALQWKSEGAYRVTITPMDGIYIVEGFFREEVSW